MRKQPSSRRRRAGFTLAETTVAVGVAVLVGGIVYQFLNSGLILAAKNTATNVAHDESRIAVARLVKDIHGAASVPQLGQIITGTSTVPGSWPVSVATGQPAKTFVPIAGTGPTAGISFQILGDAAKNSGGPFRIINDPGNDKLILIDSATQPVPGMRLIVPYYGIEDTIQKVTSTGANHWNVFLANAQETRLKGKKETFFICYYTTRLAYVVEQGELRLYGSMPPPAGAKWPVVIARNIINPADRTLPATPFTQVNTQHVGVTLTTEDDRSSNRGFRGTNTLLAGSIPHFSQICASR